MPIGAVVSGCSHSGSMNMIFIVKLGFKSTPPHTHTQMRALHFGTQSAQQQTRKH